MSIDFSSPFDFLKTMRLSDYEHPDDFFTDMNEQLDLYAVSKSNKIKSLEAENKELREDIKKLSSPIPGISDSVDLRFEYLENENKKLKEQLAKAEDALMFYAHELSWRKDKVMRQGRMIYMPKTQLYLVGYERAREYFKQKDAR